ncbi:MAG: hypothetical protein ACR2QH_03870, partial [Geminicoccaceae bacterium]
MSGRSCRPGWLDGSQSRDGFHLTPPAGHASRNVMTGETLDHSFDGFLGPDVGLGLSEQSPATCDLDPAVTIGEQPVVT